MNASKRWWLIIAAFLLFNMMAAIGLALFAHSAGESKVLPSYTAEQK
jgi:hypothetical protein